MATFYLLPPRSLLTAQIDRILAAWLPGTDCVVGLGAELVERLGMTAAGHRDVFLIHREDLPEGESVPAGLVNAFGAEDGDTVIEVKLTERSGETRVRTWLVGYPVADAA